jgi:SAM-dependent methyltransferase
MSEAQERLDTRSSADRLQVALHKQRYEFVLQNLATLESVLEIGTGEGNLSVLLAPRCGNYVGLEFDADTCARASRRLGDAYRIVRGDARALPFEARSFSGIVCLEVLEHLGDFQAGISNIQRCLQLDGRAILSVPYRRRGGASSPNVYHLYEPGEGELVTALRECFEKVAVYYQYFQETRLMSAARLFHLRRALGLQRHYRALTQGEPQALSQLKLEHEADGMKLHLVAVVDRPKPQSGE